MLGDILSGFHKTSLNAPNTESQTKYITLIKVSSLFKTFTFVGTVTDR